MDPSRAVWFKSSRSNANGACAEVANLTGAVGVRDSKNVHGGVLTFEVAHWTSFVAAFKSGRLPTCS
jgi:hypothetical protein